MASNIPDLNATGYTYKEMYRQEKHYATQEEIESVWGPKVSGKSTYRLKNLSKERYNEYMSLYRKISQRTCAWGGMASQTMAVAYYLHTKGKKVNWLSFWQQLREKGSEASPSQRKRKHASISNSEEAEENATDDASSLDVTRPQFKPPQAVRRISGKITGKIGTFQPSSSGTTI